MFSNTVHAIEYGNTQLADTNVVDAVYLMEAFRWIVKSITHVVVGTKAGFRFVVSIPTPRKNQRSKNQRSSSPNIVETVSRNTGK